MAKTTITFPSDLNLLFSLSQLMEPLSSTIQNEAHELSDPTFSLALRFQSILKPCF